MENLEEIHIYVMSRLQDEKGDSPTDWNDVPEPLRDMVDNYHESGVEWTPTLLQLMVGTYMAQFMLIMKLNEVGQALNAMQMRLQEQDRALMQLTQVRLK